MLKLYICQISKYNLIDINIKKSTWITHGLLTSIRYRDKLYNQLTFANPSSNNYETIKIYLKTYNPVLKKNIRAAKQIYFESRFSLFKNDIRKPGKQ